MSQIQGIKLMGNDKIIDNETISWMKKEKITLLNQDHFIHKNFQKGMWFLRLKQAYLKNTKNYGHNSLKNQLFFLLCPILILLIINMIVATIMPDIIFVITCLFSFSAVFCYIPSMGDLGSFEPLSDKGFVELYDALKSTPELEYAKDIYIYINTKGLCHMSKEPIFLKP